MFLCLASEGTLVVSWVEEPSPSPPPPRLGATSAPFVCLRILCISLPLSSCLCVPSPSCVPVTLVLVLACLCLCRALASALCVRLWSMPVLHATSLLILHVKDTDRCSKCQCAHILTIAHVRAHTHTHTSSLEDSRYSFNTLGCLGCEAQKEYVLAICLDQNQVSLPQPCGECLVCKLCSKEACSANPRLPPPPSIDRTDDVNDVNGSPDGVDGRTLLNLK
jgi:hypothetical protein